MMDLLSSGAASRLGSTAEFFGFGFHDEVGFLAVLTARSPLGYS